MSRVRETLQQKAGKQLPAAVGVHNPVHNSKKMKSKKMRK